MDLLTAAAGFAGGIGVAHGLAALREHRTQPVGLADLLPWGFLVDDGVILQKDGSFLAGWRYRGPDLGAAGAAELDALARRVNDALLPFADNWMFHVDAIRRPAAPYAPSQFPDAVSQCIDDERREAYTARASRQFEMDCVCIVTHIPPAELYSRITRLFVRGGAAVQVNWDAMLGEFAVALTTLGNRLSGSLALERLGSDALLAHLHECLTGLAHPVTPPPHGAYLDYTLADQEFLGGFEPKIGAQSIRVVAVQGYPPASEPGMLDLLNALPFAFRWSTRIIPLGTQAAAKLIRRHQLLWFKRRKGLGVWVQELAGGKRTAATNPDDELFLDQDARAMAQDAAVAAAENGSGAVRYCLTTQAVVVTDSDPARANHVAQEMLKALTNAGFTGRVETVNAVEAYLGSLPGSGYHNLRRPLLSSRNVVDLLPLTSVWPGLPHNPSPYFPPKSPPLLWAATTGATPFRLHLHDSDVGHTLVLGKTGAGKSVLLGMIGAQFRRYPRAQVFLFDVGYSAWLLAHAIGGIHCDVAAGRPDALRFQPLARIDEPAERAWTAEWLETAFALQGVPMTPPLRARLETALALVAQNEPPHRTLTELAVQLQDDTLVAALRPYTFAGLYGELLDASTDDFMDISRSHDQDSRFQVVETKHLFALDDQIALPVLLYLFHRLEQRLDGSPTLIVIDEAWMALLNSAFGARVNQWLLTLRKQNAAVVLATQSSAQLEQVPQRHTILDSCVTRVYLPNPDATAPGSAALYRTLGLSDREIRTIAEATPKRHYYYTSPRGRRLFELGLGPVARAFLTPAPGLTIEETKQRVEGLMARHGADWRAVWLAELGLGEWTERLRAHDVSRRDYSPDIHNGGTTKAL